jgi:glycosyltransferase involved in cell wall biosynthesis
MTAVVVHDGAVHPGGAVDVVLEAARALDADVVVGVSGFDRSWWTDRAPNDVRILKHSQRMGTLQDARNAYRMLSLSLDEYDTVVTSGPATKFFQPYDDQTHVHYLHHPPLAKLWFDGGLFAYGLSVVDRIETTSIPVLIANSELTATRCWCHYGRTVDRVVTPPVEVDSFTPRPSYTDGQFVMVGRLEDRKRPLVAVRAFAALADRPDPPTLHLVGDGPLREEVEAAASDNVVVHGYVDDETLREIIASSHAGVFLARREDFGITPIEYMAAGLPVLGVDEPNTNNQVDADSGVLVEPTVEAVRRGVETLLERTWDREAIAAAVQSYDAASFREAFHTAIEEAKAGAIAGVRVRGDGADGSDAAGGDHRTQSPADARASSNPARGPGQGRGQEPGPGGGGE